MLCLSDKDIRVVSVRSGYSSNYNYETEKTSLAYGGPHKLTCQLSCKAGGLQKRRALKCLWHSEFHHIIERPFPTGGRFPIIGKSASFFVDKVSLSPIILPKNKKNQENMHISWKKLQKNLVEQKKCSIFAPAFENDACWFGNNIRLEGWVSGWNHQFAKLTCGITVPGVRIPHLPQAGFKIASLVDSSNG